MFLAKDLPVRFDHSDAHWRGTYRGWDLEVQKRTNAGPWDVWSRGDRVTSQPTLIEALHAYKCKADWDLFLPKWGSVRDESMALAARLTIEASLDEDNRRALIDPRLGPKFFRIAADDWIRGAGVPNVERWWFGLVPVDRRRFAMDVRDCWMHPPENSAKWENVAYGLLPAKATVDAWNARYRVGTRVRYHPILDRPDYHVTRTRSTAYVVEGLALVKLIGFGPVALEAVAPHDDEPQVEVAKVPAKGRAPEPEPIERRFGHCKRCKVCLAYDVNKGCCTVCGRPLSANPSGRFLDTDNYRLQLFIPRHDKDWKGLPKGLLPDRVAKATKAPAILHNKPPGAFWTSTYGENDHGEPSSDWDQWMREEAPSWPVTRAILLRVLPTAHVKHLTTTKEAEAFLDEYGTPGPLSVSTGRDPRREEGLWGGGRMWGLFEMVPDWPRVYAAFDALHVEGGALQHPALYGWDAESTAWFNTRHLVEEGVVDLPPAADDDLPEQNPRPRRRRERRRNGKLTRNEKRKLFRSLMSKI